ncbi:MAG: hypothetical protein H6834_01015 [Planctomycetes bacterium]|nr:hypothetical protein [Planctomycetota bacterium]
MKRSSLLLGAVLLLFGTIACSDTPSPQGTKTPTRALLDSMSRGSTAALMSCLLEGDFESMHFTIALKRPDRMRLESKSDGSVRLAVLSSQGHSVSEGIGHGGIRTWTAMEPDAKQRFDELRLLLGSVLAWDLLESVEVPATSAATWFRPNPAPVVHREFDEDGTLTTISIEGHRWGVIGWHEDRGGCVPELRDANGRKLVFDRVSIGSRFLDAVFEPEEKALTLSGEREGVASLPTAGDTSEPQLNYDEPALESAHATHYIEAKAPDTWQERIALLEKLGGGLAELGQRPDGLPAYVDGHVRVFFQPMSESGEARAPEGYELHTVAKRYVLVLHHRGIPLEKAVSTLEPKLRETAKEKGYVLDGPVLVMPFVLPGNAAPEDGTDVKTRVEITAR